MEKLSVEIKKAGNILLEIGALLMSSGASTGRIRVTINRISESLGYRSELLITHRALMISVSDKEGNLQYSSLKRTSPHGVNFKLVSGISRMSWKIVDEKWPVDQIIKDVNRIKTLPHYPRIVILLFVALAGASFCRLFGGGLIEMLVAFTATFSGLFVRQEAQKKEFNPYLCVLFAAFTATFIAGASVFYGIGRSAEEAFATSVLFLIPGVPFINAFTDMIDGNISAGMARMIHGLIISFAIALGMVISILIFNL
ncbi:MAG: threonine/serine exporter family protein [Bacteroidales bacterium]